ncbi:MAG: MarR family transcriptional regulator [Coriobacteriales bacterium]|nr:MarR family transcriptional regulator [Coriobacteriales bacterium]
MKYPHSINQVENVACTSQMITVILEHLRLIAKCVKQGYNLTYGELSLLVAMFEAKRPILVEPMADFLMLKRQTLWTMMLELEDRGILCKQSLHDDMRSMLCSFSPQGQVLTEQAIQDFNRLIEVVFMPSLSSKEHAEFKDSVQYSNDALRGHTIPEELRPKPADLRFGAEYLVYWRAIAEVWEKTTHESQFALTEYRMLQILDEYGTMYPADITQKLFIERSSVSVFKTKLIERGLLREACDPFDRRRSIVQPTKEGRTAFQTATYRLSEATRMAHTGLDDNGIMVVNVWYMRMYSNLRKYTAIHRDT